MAVGANSYGTVARVEALVGDLVTARVFSTTTTPTTAQVEIFIDDVAAEINTELRAQGYTVPVANAGADVEARALLVKANSAGAASVVLSMFPGEALDPDNPAPLSNRLHFLHGQMKSALDMIREQRLPATRTTGQVARVYAGGQEDRDTGKTKLPVFTRASTDFPSSRSLTK